MAEDGIYYHVEYCGRERVALSYSTLALERGPKVASSLCHRREAVPVPSEWTQRPGDSTVLREDYKTAFAIQGIIGFMKI